MNLSVQWCKNHRHWSGEMCKHVIGEWLGESPVTIFLTSGWVWSRQRKQYIPKCMNSPHHPLMALSCSVGQFAGMVWFHLSSYWVNTKVNTFGSGLFQDDSTPSTRHRGLQSQVLKPLIHLWEILDQHVNNALHYLHQNTSWGTLIENGKLYSSLSLSLIPKWHIFYILMFIFWL